MRVILSEAHIFKGQLPRKWERPLPLPYSGSACWPAEHTTIILQTQAGPVRLSPCCLKLWEVCVVLGTQQVLLASTPNATCSCGHTNTKVELL